MWKCRKYEGRRDFQNKTGNPKTDHLFMSSVFTSPIIVIIPAFDWWKLLKGFHLRCCLLERKHYLTVRAVFSLCHCCVWRQPGGRFICSSVRRTFLEVPAGSVSHRPAGQPASQAAFRFTLFLKFSTAYRLWRHVYLDNRVSLGHCSSSTDSLVLCVEPVCYHQSCNSRLQGTIKSEHQLSCCNAFKHQ